MVNLTAIMAGLLTAHAAAILTTAFRLFLRFRKRQLWWDDFWAGVGVSCDMAAMIVYIALPIPIQLRMSISKQSAIKWTSVGSFTIALWAARLSIGTMLIRVHAPGSIFRRISKAVCFLFGTICVGLLVQKAFYCGSPPRLQIAKCRYPLNLGITELTTDVVADSWLLGAPVYMLWRMQMIKQKRRILLLVLFQTSVFLTGASIVHDYFIFNNSFAWVGVTAHLEMSISIVVCNVLVIVTYIYSVYFEEREETTPTREPEGHTFKLTTVFTASRSYWSSGSSSNPSAIRLNASDLQTNSDTEQQSSDSVDNRVLSPPGIPTVSSTMV